jgi:NAD(P)-dependent dehydrogenase (short-subunit alcohol dehydrogenase family)
MLSHKTWETEMRFDLEGRVAVVTGAAGSVGRAICNGLIQQGVTVIATDLRSRIGAEDDGHRALDVTDAADWEALADWIGDRHGALDLLVNNAGVAPMAALENFTQESWRLAFAVNVEGVFLGMKAMLPLLRAGGTRRDGTSAIVNIASASSQRATGFATAYGATKAAIAQLTKSAGIEFAQMGYPVRAVSIHPACVRSDMIDAILKQFSDLSGGVPVSTLRDQMIADHPLKRMVEPSEVADAVLFLASDAASYLNATELHVDGGLIAG